MNKIQKSVIQFKKLPQSIERTSVHILISNVPIVVKVVKWHLCIMCTKKKKKKKKKNEYRFPDNLF